ncbi:MAG: hypothetical protein AAF970_13635 [Bacteroidota bacterium]
MPRAHASAPTRLLLLLAAALVVVLPCAAQHTGDHQAPRAPLFPEIILHIDLDLATVRAHATDTARDYAYLRDLAMTTSPFPLVDGDVWLNIDAVWFTIYLRRSNGYTVVRMASDQAQVPPPILDKAEAFLEDVARRASGSERQG